MHDLLHIDEFPAYKRKRADNSKKDRSRRHCKICHTLTAWACSECSGDHGDYPLCPRDSYTSKKTCWHTHIHDIDSGRTV